MTLIQHKCTLCKLSLYTNSQLQSSPVKPSINSQTHTGSIDKVRVTQWSKTEWSPLNWPKIHTCTYACCQHSWTVTCIQCRLVNKVDAKRSIEHSDTSIWALFQFYTFIILRSPITPAIKYQLWIVHRNTKLTARHTEVVRERLNIYQWTR